MAALLLGCGRTGEATTDIDQAETEVERLTGEIVSAISLEVTAEVPLGTRVRCELPTEADGASNALAVRGPIPEVDDPLGRASAVLVDAGYELIDSDLEQGVFARRDGIRITVALDPPTGELAIDANTGCRPLPAG